MFLESEESQTVPELWPFSCEFSQVLEDKKGYYVIMEKVAGQDLTLLDVRCFDLHDLIEPMKSKACLINGCVEQLSSQLSASAPWFFHIEFVLVSSWRCQEAKVVPMCLKLARTCLKR